MQRETFLKLIYESLVSIPSSPYFKLQNSVSFEEIVRKREGGRAPRENPGDPEDVTPGKQRLSFQKLWRPRLKGVGQAGVSGTLSWRERPVGRSVGFEINTPRARSPPGGWPLRVFCHEHSQQLKSSSLHSKRGTHQSIRPGPGGQGCHPKTRVRARLPSEQHREGGGSVLPNRAPTRVEARPLTEGANMGVTQGLGVQHEAHVLLPSLLGQLGGKRSHRSS